MESFKTHSPTQHLAAGEAGRRLSFGGMQFHVGGCQNYGPFLGPHYNTAPII